MGTKLIVGMLGKAGSGKDTVAEYLINKNGFYRLALADPLKSAIKEMFLLDDFTTYDRHQREQPLPDFPDWSPRKLFQFVGTELMRRQFDQCIWSKLLVKRIRGSQCSKIVISDVRFPDEQQYLQKLKDDGYQIIFIKVKRDGCVGNNVGLSNHESEQYELNSDYEILNNGTLEELYFKVDTIIKSHLNME